MDLHNETVHPEIAFIVCFLVAERHPKSSSSLQIVNKYWREIKAPQV